MKRTIQAMLSAIKEVEALAYIADDAGQADVEVNTPGTQPIRMPAALVGLSSAAPGATTKDHIRDDVTFSVRLFDAPGVVANVKAPDSHRDASLLIYDIRSEVIRAVSAIPGVRYAGTSRPLRADGIRELLLLFRATIEL